MYGDSEYWACSAQRRSIARPGVRRRRSSRSWRSSSARFSSRSVRTRSALAFGRVIRATYELDPPEAAETLALIESVGRADGPAHVRGRVADLQHDRAVLEFPEANWGGDVTLLVSSLVAGEWADSAAFGRCRLVDIEWPAGLLPGPAFDAPQSVLVGAIVKPSLGLSPAEVATTAARLAAGGADLIKDDELRNAVARFPTVASVAPGSTDRVLHSWSSGLSGPGQIGIGRVLMVCQLAVRSGVQGQSAGRCSQVLRCP